MTLPQMKAFLEDLNSIVNKHETTYNSVSQLVGGAPLTDITKTQISEHFNNLLSADGILLIELGIKAMEDIIPKARILKAIIDASQYSSIDKLTG